MLLNIFEIYIVVLCANVEFREELDNYYKIVYNKNLIIKSTFNLGNELSFYGNSIS